MEIRETVGEEWDSLAVIVSQGSRDIASIGARSLSLMPRKVYLYIKPLDLRVSDCRELKALMEQELSGWELFAEITGTIEKRFARFLGFVEINQCFRRDLT